MSGTGIPRNLRNYLGGDPKIAATRAIRQVGKPLVSALRILAVFLVSIRFWGLNQELSDAYLESSLTIGMNEHDIVGRLSEHSIIQRVRHPGGSVLKVSQAGIGALVTPQREVTLHLDATGHLAFVRVEVSYQGGECEYNLLSRRQ